MLKQEVKGQQQEQKVKDQGVKRDQVRSPNQEVLGQQGQDLSWKING